MWPHKLKNILLKNKTYLRFRYSPFVMRSWLILRPEVRKKLKAQREYYGNFIQKLKQGQHLSFDIGANEGFVSEILLMRDLSVVAVEPDERNINILTARFAGNSKFRLLPNAAGSELSNAELYIQKEGTALSTLNPKWKELIESGNYRIHSDYENITGEISVTTLDHLIGRFGLPALLKIDVEGYELEVLKGLTYKVPLILFEANLPEFLQETFLCMERLYQIDNNAVFNYSYTFHFGSSQFLGLVDFKKVLNEIRESNVDIVCIMSNYFEYYEMLPVSKPG